MPSVTEELKELFALFEKGAITREEYEGHKAALLSGGRGASGPGVPNQVGAYRILAHIGDGGFGTVYRGRHRSPEIAERQGGDVAV